MSEENQVKTHWWGETSEEATPLDFGTIDNGEMSNVPIQENAPVVSYVRVEATKTAEENFKDLLLASDYPPEILDLVGTEIAIGASDVNSTEYDLGNTQVSVTYSGNTLERVKAGRATVEEGDPRYVGFNNDTQIHLYDRIDWNYRVAAQFFRNLKGDHFTTAVHQDQDAKDGPAYVSRRTKNPTVSLTQRYSHPGVTQHLVNTWSAEAFLSDDHRIVGAQEGALIGGAWMNLSDEERSRRIASSRTNNLPMLTSALDVEHLIIQAFGLDKTINDMEAKRLEQGGQGEPFVLSKWRQYFPLLDQMSKSIGFQHESREAGVTNTLTNVTPTQKQEFRLGKNTVTFSHSAVAESVRRLFNNMSTVEMDVYGAIFTEPMFLQYISYRTTYTLPNDPMSSVTLAPLPGRLTLLPGKTVTLRDPETDGPTVPYETVRDVYNPYTNAGARPFYIPMDTLTKDALDDGTFNTNLSVAVEKLQARQLLEYALIARPNGKNDAAARDAYRQQLLSTLEAYFEQRTTAGEVTRLGTTKEDWIKLWDDIKAKFADTVAPMFFDNLYLVQPHDSKNSPYFDPFTINHGLGYQRHVIPFKLNYNIDQVVNDKGIMVGETFVMVERACVAEDLESYCELGGYENRTTFNDITTKLGTIASAPNLSEKHVNSVHFGASIRNHDDVLNLLDFITVAASDKLITNESGTVAVNPEETTEEVINQMVDSVVKSVTFLKADLANTEGNILTVEKVTDTETKNGLGKLFRDEFFNTATALLGREVTLDEIETLLANGLVYEIKPAAWANGLFNEDKRYFTCILGTGKVVTPAPDAVGPFAAALDGFGAKDSPEAIEVIQN